MNLNNNYMNPIDRSIIRMNQIIPEIMDRMVEIYKAYAPKVMETVSQRVEENGGRLQAYRQELKKDFYYTEDDCVDIFVDRIPFSALIRIVEPSLNKTFISKVVEIVKMTNNEYLNNRSFHERISGDSDISNLDDMVSRAVYETEGYQKFVDFEITGIYPGRIPTYNCRKFDSSVTDKTNDSNFNNKARPFSLPVIGVYNKFNVNLFNKIFTPEARILEHDSKTSNHIDHTFRSKHLDSHAGEFTKFLKGEHQNVMLIDVDSIFETIMNFWSDVIYCNIDDTDSISDEDRKKIEKLFSDKALFPNLTTGNLKYSNTSRACRTFHLLSLNQTTSPEYKTYFREFDLLHSFAMKAWSLVKKQIVSSAITTYLANVCSRTHDFTNNMIDDVVNKYLTITSQDNSVINSNVSYFNQTSRNISTVRSKARDFYSLFRNFLTTPSLNKRNMINFDDVAISSCSLTNHMSARQFVCYILRKIYEHECVTYNTTYNIINDDTSFKFVQTDSMAKKMLVHITSPEAKSIVEQHKKFIGNKSLLGHDKFDIGYCNSQNPLVYLARNHRALSSIYKEMFVAFICYIDAYRLKKNISKDNLNADVIIESIRDARRKLLDCLNKMSDLCSGKFSSSHQLSRSLFHLSSWYPLPILNVGLFYDGVFNINYEILSSRYDILLTDYSRRIVDVLSPKNLRRQNIGYSQISNRFINSNDDGGPNIRYAEDGPLPCCYDGGDISYDDRMPSLSDIDDLGINRLTSLLGISRYGDTHPKNVQISQTPYTDFGQFDAELDSGLNSYEDLNSKINFKLTKTPSLKTVEKVALKLNNLKTLKILDLATVAYGAQVAVEKLDFDSLSEKEKKEANESIKTIDSKLREVLNGRIYRSLEEINKASMESIDFSDSI